MDGLAPAGLPANAVSMRLRRASLTRSRALTAVASRAAAVGVARLVHAASVLALPLAAAGAAPEGRGEVEANLQSVIEVPQSQDATAGVGHAVVLSQPHRLVPMLVS